LPARSPIDPLSPLLELIDARRLERRRTARDRFAAGPELSGACERRGRVQVRTGLFVKHVADHAAALHPALIMVPPRKHGLGSIVTTLTRTANVPVLVLRESRSERAIVAATDLEDAEYSVLRAAAELGNQLHWRVIPFHNVTPISMPVSVETLSPITILTGSAEAENRQIRLARASRQLQIDAPAVTASEVNPVDAILRIAQTKDAGMVVVGARPRSWFGHLIARGVAAQVVNCAQRSVLVTPLATPRSAPAAPLAEC
jgi:nucleotide-binding universal stress UspA family protein